MKIGSIKYLTKEAFKGAWANRLMSLASIGVLVACMVVIGLALLISENVTLAVGKLEKENVVFAYMKDERWVLYASGYDDLPEKPSNVSNDSYEDDYQKWQEEISELAVINSEEEAYELCDKIAELDNVHSVEFISSDEGLESIKGTLLKGQEENFAFLEEDEDYGNPLPCAAKITMEDMSKFDTTVKAIEKLDGIGNIRMHTDLAEKIDTIKTGIYVAGFWIIAILVVISLVIVSNTIRVTMYNRKLEIGIMKAVGATDAFVRIPFVIEGIIIGLISTLISEVLIYFCYRVATEKISAMLGSVVPFGDMAWVLLGVFALIGVFAGAIGSTLMIGKYLKHEGSEFTAFK